MNDAPSPRDGSRGPLELLDSLGTVGASINFPSLLSSSMPHNDITVSESQGPGIDPKW